jgi:eukaryotic-like serine/threonine-protein kinase
LERLTPFGKYYLLERINVGGMAEVFKAKTVGVEGFEKIVAIKRILPSVAEDEEFIKMFIDEAKITSQLSHANLAQTFDLGKFADAYYIAMEYVPGKDLRAVQERLRRRGDRIPLSIAAYVVGKVCEGLDYAHRKRDASGRELNIVHRDVSPQNVIVSYEGEVKLVDFGIAKAANKITRTQAGILKGKFGYMSPEQVRGLPLDRRSDIFAAGVVLDELCTGERLFTGSSDFSVLEKVQEAEITPPSVALPEISPRLEKVILKALAREPERRYQHAADFAQDLQRYLIEAQPRSISRDDVSAFMKSTFPDEDARERQAPGAVLDPTLTRAPRKGPPPLPEAAARLPRPSKPPPKLPASLTAGLPLDDEDVEPTQKGPLPEPLAAAPRPPSMPPQGQASASLPPPASVLPPLPSLPPLRAQQGSRIDGPGNDDRTDPGLLASPPEDEPTRPMSMDELAAAERVFAERQKKLATRAVERDVTAPGGEPSMMHAGAATPAASTAAGSLAASNAATASPATSAATSNAAAAKAGGSAPSNRGAQPTAPLAAGPRSVDLPAPARPLPPPPIATPGQVAKLERTGEGRSKPPLLPSSLFEDLLPDDTPPGPPPPVDSSPPEAPPASIAGSEPRRGRGRVHGRGRRGESPRAAGPRNSGAPRPHSEDKLAPFGGRMGVSRPTLVGTDPAAADEDTISTLTRRARWVRRGQLALLAGAIGVALWAWLSVPHTKEDPTGAPPSGSVSVTTEPEDAVVLLDGAQVKDPLDRDFTEPKLSSGTEHVLTVRRDGFVEQVLPMTLQAGEKKVLQVKLLPLPGQLTVRSSPGGAQVFLDGAKVGITPAYLPDVKQEEAHAIVLEKRCFRAWQVAIPAHAGKREIAATLEAIPGACMGQRVEKEEKASPELPVDDPAAMASLGFLSLGSRPSANVVIDGVDIGRTTPLVQWPLKVGKHKVKLVVGAKRKEVAIEVRSGQTVSEIVDLRKAK